MSETPKTPSQEIRAIKAELEETRDERRSKWAKAGKGLGTALLAATAAYGAGRPSGEEASQEAKLRTAIAYEESIKAITDLQRVARDHADRIREFKSYQSAALQKLASDNASEIASMRSYMEGYLAALGGKGQRPRQEVEDLKRQLVEQTVKLKAKEALGTVQQLIAPPRAAQPEMKLQKLDKLYEQRKAAE